MKKEQTFIQCSEILLNRGCIEHLGTEPISISSVLYNNLIHLQETYYAEKNRKWYIEFLKLACGVAKDAVVKTFPNTQYETIASNFLQENLYDDLINLVSTRCMLISILTN